MARDRLAGVQRNYGDAPAPQQTTYPPPANGVIPPSRQPNPYAQQNAGPGGYGQQAGNPYAQQNAGNGGYGQQAGNPYAQQQYGQQQGYAAGGGAVNGGGVDRFYEDVGATQALLTQLDEQIKAVRSAHAQSLASTDANAGAYADQLNEQARATREECKNQIKRLFKLAKGDKAKKTQVEVVKSRFTTLLNEHQVVEKEFRQKVRGRVERQYRIVKPDATDEEVREVVESDNPQVFQQALMNSGRYASARGALKEVQDRHVEIQKIEKTLTELAQMFNEMAMLVEQQDETIVNVEGQAQGVDTDIKQGLVQTERAVESARKARRKKWICFWICVLILVIAGLAIGLAIGLKKN